LIVANLGNTLCVSPFITAAVNRWLPSANILQNHAVFLHLTKKILSETDKLKYPGQF